METLAGETGDSMRRLIVIPAMAVLGLSAFPLFPIQSPPIHTPRPHQVMAAPVMSPQTDQTASITSERVEPTPTPSPQPVIAGKPISGTKTDWMAAAGIPQDVWGCVDSLVSRESGWRVNATNATSGAYGLPQALPGSKMAAMGPDWQTNPITQLRWMAQYVAKRYGGWCEALAFQMSRGWY